MTIGASAQIDLNLSPYLGPGWACVSQPAQLRGRDLVLWSDGASVVPVSSGDRNGWPGDQGEARKRFVPVRSL